MIELRITGDTPQEFLNQLLIANAALNFRGMLADAKQAAPGVGNVESQNVTDTTQEPVERTADEPVKAAAKKGRLKKEEVQVPDPGPAPIVAEAEAVEIETPKDLEAMRAFLNGVIAKVNTEKVAKVISNYAISLSKVPLDKYPDLAREAHKLLEGVK